MRQNRTILGLLLLLFIFTAACGTLNRLNQRVSEAQGTVESAVTAAVQIATISGPLLTVRALATDVPSLQETVAVLITENPGVISTVEALTRGINLGDFPEDIPVVDDSTILQSYASDTVVYYLTRLDFPTVLAFYQAQMPLYGWELVSQWTTNEQALATLTWNQGSRQATIAITTTNTTENSTRVAITIQSR